MADTESKRSPDLARLAQDGPEWSGCLTIENAAAVAARIERLLKGRLYAWALDWLSPDGAIELHTSMKARDFKVTSGDGSAHISWCDGYGLHMHDTRIRDRAHENDLTYAERRRKSTYFHFSGEQFTTDSFAPSGNHCRSTFRVEYPEHLSDDYA